MSRNKLRKFQENEQSDKVIQVGKPAFSIIKGNWRSRQFDNKNPVVLEVACGRGEYTVGFARLFPEKNFVGIDVKGNRLWAGANIAEEENLKNAAFLRIQMHQLADFFGHDEVNEIWIIHPDPRPKKRDIRRRLTSPRYLGMYKEILAPGGLVHLKTDSSSLFEYTLEELHGRKDVIDLVYTPDLDQSPYLADHHGIQTNYELRFRGDGEKIKYLKFRFS